MLSNNDALRKESESALMNAGANNLNIVIPLIIEIIEDASVDLSVKTTSIVYPNKLVSKNKGADEITYYSKLSVEIRNTFQFKVLHLLSTLTDAALVNSMSDLVADLACSLFNNDNLKKEEKWPNLMDHLIELFGTNQEKPMLSVLRIMDTLFSHSPNEFMSYCDKISQVFRVGFANPKTDIKQ